MSLKGLWTGISPLWSRSPFVLRYFPGLLIGVVFGGLLLALALSLPSMYLSAVASNSLESSVNGSTRYTSGFFMNRQESLDKLDARLRVANKNYFRRQTNALRASASHIPHLGSLITTIISQPVTGIHTDSFTVRLMSRTRVRSQLRLLSGSSKGFLVPDTVAQTLHLSPGDVMTLRYKPFVTAPGAPRGPQQTRIRVTGIYRNLVFQTNRPYWSNLVHEIKPAPGAIPPPPFVIGSQGAVARLLHRLEEPTATFWWELPVKVHPELTVPQARMTSQRLRGLIRRVGDPTTHLGSIFFCRVCRFLQGASASLGEGLGREVQQIDSRLTALSPPVQSLAGAGGVVAIAVVTSAAAYAARRRRSETVLLLARGQRAPVLAARSVVEIALPLVLGTVAGILVARSLVAVVQPRGSLDTSALSNAATRAGLALPVAALAFYLTAWVMVRLSGRVEPILERRHGLPFPWELVPLAGAAAIYATTEPGTVSFAGRQALAATLVLLGFPLLSLLAASGLVTRTLRASLTCASAASERLAVPLFLSINRLKTSTATMVALVIAAATSLGLLSYADAMASSLSTTTLAKASVFVGGDVSVPVDFGYHPPASFPYRTSLLYQINTSAALPGGSSVGILAIDPKTFATATRWNDSFSSTALRVMMHRLESRGSRLPFIAVGRKSPTETQLSLQGTTIPLRSVASATAFPGTFGDTPWLVVSSDPFRRTVESISGTDPSSLASSPEMIVRGDASKVKESLEQLGFSPSSILTRKRILSEPTYQAAQSTLTVLRILGAITALLSVVGLLLYVQARQRERTLAAALTVRMGLSDTRHGFAVMLELATMLILATAVAVAGGSVAASVSHSWLDPIPQVPPPPMLVLPITPIPMMFLGALFISFAGAATAQWWSHRMNLAQEMRRVG